MRNSVSGLRSPRKPAQSRKLQKGNKTGTIKNRSGPQRPLWTGAQKREPLRCGGRKIAQLGQRPLTLGLMKWKTVRTGKRRESLIQGEIGEEKSNSSDVYEKGSQLKKRPVSEATSKKEAVQKKKRGEHDRKAW